MTIGRSCARVMTNTTWDILRGFLRSPFERTRFNAFFEIAFRQTVSYLRHLQYHGYRLPVDDRTNADPLVDLAIDVLGEIAAPRDHCLFPELFDFLSGRCDRRYPDSEQEKIVSLFTAFLTVQIRQRLSRLKGERDPQTENLKRRIKDILKEPPFETIANHGGSEIVVQLQEGGSEHDGHHLIPISELRHLVETAFLKSNSRSTWCHLLFELLKENSSQPPRVRLSELLALMVEVNSRFIENGSRPANPFPSPKLEMLRKKAESAKSDAVESARSGILQRFVGSGRLTTVEAEYFIDALTRYMEDFSSSGETDPIPTYFRESLPDETHSRYLRDYKYLFETVLNGARERFLAILRDDPTIRDLGDYIYGDGEKKGPECTSHE